LKVSSTYICPSCEVGQTSIFYELKDFPVHTVLNIATRAEALGYRRGDIRLAFCPECGFISNVSFDPGLLEYGSNCEEGQGFSPTFRAFAQSLARRLVDRYGLKGKTVLEIGCGKGEFLSMLCEYGGNRGIGFDPAYVQGRFAMSGEGSVEFVKDFYSEKYSHYRADFICCQMTLEHIQPVCSFVGMVRRAIGENESAVVFFQVPDVTRILRDCAFEDIYYEHCSYFSPGSLARLFRKNGFDVLDLRVEYDGQYLVIEARPSMGMDSQNIVFPLEQDLTFLQKQVSTFTRRVSDKIAFWRNSTENSLQGEKRGVIWGSGSKGVAFLINLGLEDHVKYVVDINPHRQGMFMPGTGQEIVSPAALRKIHPDVVIVMNRVYQKEIREELEGIGLTPEIVAL
jgi:SAM-dependent methyltransferase